MVNDIINGISVTLNTEFGDDHTIYAEEVEQGLKEPCFFINAISPTRRVYVGKRYFRENLFCIQYFPQDKYSPNEECNSVADRLFRCLEYITVTGDLIRGTNMRCEYTDGILNFFVNYNFFEWAYAPKTSMEDYQHKIGIKEEGDENR